MEYISKLCCCLVTKSCPTLCNPMDCSPPGSSVHGISQARILEWVVIFICWWNSPGKNTGVGNHALLQPGLLSVSSQPRIEPRSPALHTDSSSATREALYYTLSVSSSFYTIVPSQVVLVTKNPPSKMQDFRLKFQSLGWGQSPDVGNSGQLTPEVLPGKFPSQRSLATDRGGCKSRKRLNTHISFLQWVYGFQVATYVGN